MLLRSKQVSERLGIPATTLRLWSNEFADFLSESAQASVSERGTPTQRKYTEADIELLTQVQSLLSVGLVYDAIREVLTNNPTAELSLPELALQASPNGHSNGQVALPASVDLTEVVALLKQSVAFQEEANKIGSHITYTQERVSQSNDLMRSVLEEILHELRAQSAPAPPPVPRSFFERLKALFL